MPLLKTITKVHNLSTRTIQISLKIKADDCKKDITVLWCCGSVSLLMLAGHEKKKNTNKYAVNPKVTRADRNAGEDGGSP